MNTIRNTYSLDSETVAAIRTLAQDWNTSQAGVVRRAVREALARQKERLGPKAALACFRAGQVPMHGDELARIAAVLRRDRLDADAARP